MDDRKRYVGLGVSLGLAAALAGCVTMGRPLPESASRPTADRSRLLAKGDDVPLRAGAAAALRPAGGGHPGESGQAHAGDSGKETPPGQGKPGPRAEDRPREAGLDRAGHPPMTARQLVPTRRRSTPASIRTSFG